MSNLQMTFSFKKNIWSAPSEYKDLSQYDEIAIDLETRDEGLNAGLGAGWATVKSLALQSQLKVGKGIFRLHILVVVT
jgi:hypothetical protein